MTSRPNRPWPERGSFIVEPSSAKSRVLCRSSSRFMTACRITKLILDRPSSSWLRWTRRSRSTWPRPFEAAPFDDVDEVPDLHGVAGEEGQRLEQAPPAGVLAGERLDQAGQLGEEEVDQRPGDKLGDPAAAALLEDAALDDRAAVVALDVLDALLGDQRADRAVDHARVPVADVRVGPDDDVAAGLVEALPQRLALAGEAAVARQNLLVDDHSGAFRCGDLAGPIGRVGVDDEQLVHQRMALHQLAPGPADDRRRSSPPR